MRFIVEFLDGHFNKYPNVDYVIMRSGMVELYRDNTDIPRETQMPFAAINLMYIAHYWLKGDPAMLNSKTEQYLSENHGDLQKYYKSVGAGHTAGVAFLSSLSAPDQFRIKRVRRFDEPKIRAVTEFEDPMVLEVIEFLESTLSEYPEDHPVWSVR